MSGIEIAHEMLAQSLKTKFGSVTKEIEQRIELIEDKNMLKNLINEILKADTIEEFKDVFFKSEIPSGKSGLIFRHNYDAVVKWMGEQFKGKTLEIFGIKTEPIVELFNFEPVTIRIDTGRIDLMLGKSQKQTPPSYLSFCPYSALRQCTNITICTHCRALNTNKNST